MIPSAPINNAVNTPLTMKQLETLLRLFCRLRLRIGFASCIAIVPTCEPLLQADGASLVPAPFTMTILKEEVSAFGEDDLLDIEQPIEACTIDLCYANRVGVDHVIGLAPGIDDGVEASSAVDPIVPVGADDDIIATAADDVLEVLIRSTPWRPKSARSRSRLMCTPKSV